MFFKDFFKKYKPLQINGTGCTDIPIGLKLIKKPIIIGEGFHRSGWPWVFNYLETINSEDGILFDDFIEQNFCYNNNPFVYQEPWVGIFHHPPTIPYFGNPRENLELVFRSLAFKKSQRHLKLAIALSNHLGNYLKQKLDCPVIVLKHPANVDVDTWNPSLYDNNTEKSLIQIGYYLRNTQLIRHIPNTDLKKIRLWNNSHWANSFDNRVEKYYRFKRTCYDNYLDKKFIPASEYDDLLTKNIVVMEVFDASASNGVLDCIVRNTPIIINRHPAVVEYLGAGYPLYFDSPQQIPNLARRAMKGYEYLTQMDKNWLSGEKFVSSITESIHETLLDNMR